MAGLPRFEAAVRSRRHRGLPGHVPRGPRHQPAEFPRNQYLGLVETRPDPTKYVLGFNYYDAADDGDNEDMYTIDVTTGELKPSMRGSFEREHPEYAGHHRANKDYLRKKLFSA
jgi:hypothetical protein